MAQNGIEEAGDQVWRRSGCHLPHVTRKTHWCNRELNTLTLMTRKATLAHNASTGSADLRRPPLSERRLGRLATRILPLHILRPLRFELRMLAVRPFSVTVRYRYRHAVGLNVNIGSGYRGHAGWVNLDALGSPGVSHRYDLRRRLPFGDGSVHILFTEHLLEHLDYEEEVPLLLRECHRVLQHDGLLRVVVPDGERYLRSYCEPGWSAMEDFSPLLELRSFRTKMEVVNAHMRLRYQHRFSYDYEALEVALRDAGFTNVVRKEFGMSFLQEACLDTPERSSESLYVEARP